MTVMTFICEVILMRSIADLVVLRCIVFTVMAVHQFTQMESIEGVSSRVQFIKQTVVVVMQASQFMLRVLLCAFQMFGFIFHGIGYLLQGLLRTFRCQISATAESLVAMRVHVCFMALEVIVVLFHEIVKRGVHDFRF